MSLIMSVMMNELTQGRELAKQLHNHLDPCSPHETREYLIEKIISTYNNLLHMTNLDPSHTSFQMDPNSLIRFNGGATETSLSSVSPSSDLDNRHRSSKKRRKSLARWVETIKVSAEERSVDDGYSWRKYGQKAILGATFPRGYYRCSHRNTRGCYATKQVQKSTEDHTLLQVIYKGHHTCAQPSTSKNSPPVLHMVKPGPSKQGDQDLMDQTPVFVQQPQFKVKAEEPETLDVDKIFKSFLETAGGAPSPATVWTPGSDVHDQVGSGPDSPFGTLDFTFDDLGIIDPNWCFDDPTLFC